MSQQSITQKIDRKAIIKLIQELEESNDLEKEVCPVCGGEVLRVNRCHTCTDCGWSTCDL